MLAPTREITRQKLSDSLTVLQGGQFAALKKGIFLEILMILSNFKAKKSSFWPFLLEK